MTIDNIFSSFNKLTALVIGDVMIDAYLWGKVERISPEAPVPIINISKKENRMGGAANVAINIQALGATPILCSVIGNDTTADAFNDLMQKQGLPTSGIVKSADRTTTIKTRVIGNNYQMIRLDEEIETPINISDSNLLLNKVIEILNTQKIDVIIFEDYDKGVLHPTLIEKITLEANNRNIPTTVDPKKKNFLHYKNVSLFKPNLKEMKEGMGADFEGKDVKALSKVAAILKEKNNIKAVMVTLSELGVFSKNNTNEYLIPAHIRNIADVSGAGDTVISVASLCVALNLPHRQTAAIANLAGGLVCEKIGVVSIDKDLLYAEALKL
jgi:rfaE bifunctional protein kinase chain/domain